jgi:hypothetical protein
MVPAPITRICFIVMVSFDGKRANQEESKSAREQISMGASEHEGK